MNIRLAACGVERDVADLVADQQRDPLQPASSVSSLPWRCASASRATHSVAVREQDALAGEARADPQGDREMCLAGPGRVGVALLMLWSLCRSGCG